MAEAIAVLGLMGSCVEILKIIHEITTVARQYIHTNAAAKKELVPLLGTFIAYEGLLNGILCEAELDDDQQERLSALAHVQGPLDACRDAITAVHRRLEFLPKHVLFGKIVDKTTEQALKRMNDLKPILELALHADQRTLTLSIEKFVRDTSSQLAALRSEHAADVEARRTKEAEEKREQVLDWISTAKPQQNYEATQSRLYADVPSGQWLLESESYTTFLSGQSHLWIKGASGTGKTVLATRLISDLDRRINSSSQRALLCYYYFDFSEPLKRNAEGLVRWLLRCLTAENSATYTFITEVIRQQNDSPLSLGLTLEVWLELLELASRNSEDLVCYIVCDALDENDDDWDLECAIDAFRRMKNARCIFTSQESFEIDKDCAPSPLLEVTMEPKLIAEDISKYVETRISRDSRLSKFPDATRELIRRKVSDKAGGMFRWAQCSLDSIQRLKDRRHPIVDAILDRLPDTVTAIYDKALRTIEPITSQIMIERTLLFLAVVSRPVTIHELAEFAAIDDRELTLQKARRFHDSSDLIRLLGSFVTMRGIVVTLAHKSVKDYMMKRNGKSFSNGNTFAHRKASDMCRAYVSTKIKLEEIQKPSTTLQGGINTRLLEQLQLSFPFLTYACTQWMQHSDSAILRGEKCLPSFPLQQAFELGGSLTLWKTWLLLQPADIWEHQMDFALQMSLSIAHSFLDPDWCAGFWSIREVFRKSTTTIATAIAEGPSKLPTPASSSDSKIVSRLSTYWKVHYYIGIVLLEIGLQRSLFGKEWNDYHAAPTILAEVMHREMLNDRVKNLSTLSTEVIKRMGVNYGSAITYCLRGLQLNFEDGTGGLLSPTDMDDLYENIINPLRASKSAGFRSSRLRQIYTGFTRDREAEANEETEDDTAAGTPSDIKTPDTNTKRRVSGYLDSYSPLAQASVPAYLTRAPISAHPSNLNSAPAARHESSLMSWRAGDERRRLTIQEEDLDMKTAAAIFANNPYLGQKVLDKLGEEDDDSDSSDAEDKQEGNRTLDEKRIVSKDK